MVDILFENFTSYSFDLQNLVLNVFVAFFMGALLTVAYRLTYKGMAPSNDFSVSLGMIVIITTFIMSVISSNVALSLGLVGALSIIRFRNAVKNIKDSTFIFFAVAIGLTCGVGEYLFSLISTIAILLFLVIFQGVQTSTLVLVIIRAEKDAVEPVTHFVERSIGSISKLKMKNVNKEFCELIYEVKYEQLLKREAVNKFDLSTSLLNINGVMDVNQVGKDIDASL